MIVFAKNCILYIEIILKTHCIVRVFGEFHKISMKGHCWSGEGWSDGAMVLGKLPVPGRPTVWMIVGQGPCAVAVGAGGGCLDIFSLIYLFSSFSLSLGDGPI